MIARLVVDDEPDVDAARAGVERDLGPDRARHQLG